MNKNHIIYKAAGLILIIGGILMTIIYLLVEWGGLDINLPEVSFVLFWILPVWIGCSLYRYSPNLSKTAKSLMWASVALFVISLPMLFLGQGTWINQAGDYVVIASFLLACIAYLLIFKEGPFREEEDEKN